jgi:RNA polymerase sigma-B factor
MSASAPLRDAHPSFAVRVGGQRRGDFEERREVERELFARYARTRDRRILEELVERFTPLVRRLASRYRGGPEDFDDLLQVARLGLVKAIGRFDPELGNTFTAYAVPTILGELRRHFRDTGWALHVDRGLQERNGAVENAVTELTKRFGRSPSVGEIAQRVELSTEQVLEAIEAGNAHHTLSMDRSGQDGDDEELPPMHECLGEDDPAYDVVEYGASIAGVVAELPQRERTMLHLRFVEDMTQSEIAERVGISQMHVSRILRATVQRLRDRVEAPAHGESRAISEPDAASASGPACV